MELMEYDLDIVHRPGLECNVPDLLSRAEVVEDEAVRATMARDLLEQRARQLLARAKLGEDVTVLKAQSEGRLQQRLKELLEKPAQRALRGDTQALEKAEMDRHVQLLVQGVEVVGDSDEARTLQEKVEQTTRNMQAGTHIPKLGEELYAECIEDDPSMIEAYDLVCAVRTRASSNAAQAAAGSACTSSDEEASRSEGDSSADSSNSSSDSGSDSGSDSRSDSRSDSDSESSSSEEEEATEKG